MTKLCCFGKRASLPCLEHTASAPLPHLWNHWQAPSAVFSSAGRPECRAELGLLNLVSWGRFCPGTRQAGAEGCGYIVGRRELLLSPCELSFPHLRKGKKYPSPSYRLAGTTPTKDYLDQSCQVLDTLPRWAQFHRRIGRAAQSWDIQTVRPSEAIVWDLDEVHGWPLSVD